VLTLVAACSEEPQPRVPSGPAVAIRAAILPVESAPELLEQCSRDTLSPVESFWLPSQLEVNALETRLPGYLEERGWPAPSKPLHVYVRQYAGVVSRGRRVIYTSFLHESSLPDFPEWHLQAAIVCDGGDHYWGIAYDVATGEFVPPEYNGAL